MLELLGFIALVAILFGVSFSGAIGIIFKGIIWVFGIMIGILLLGKFIEWLNKPVERKKAEPEVKLPTIKPYKKLTKKPGIDYKYDLLDPVVRRAIDVTFGNQKYDVLKMTIYVNKDNIYKIKGFEKWLINLGVLDKEDISSKNNNNRIYRLKMTDIDEFAKLVGLEKE